MVHSFVLFIQFSIYHHPLLFYRPILLCTNTLQNVSRKNVVFSTRVHRTATKKKANKKERKIKKEDANTTITIQKEKKKKKKKKKKKRFLVLYLREEGKKRKYGYLSK